MVQAYPNTTPSHQRREVVFNLYDLLHRLGLDLTLGHYHPQSYRCFVVEEPKLREIFAPSFPDRLVHHLVVDRLLPFLDQRLIFDSFANRPQKGTHSAAHRLQSFMRRLPPTAYAMKCDIAAYFTSIDRDKLQEIVLGHLGRVSEIDAGERVFLTDIIKKVLAQNPAHNPQFSGNSRLLREIPRHKSLFHTPPHIGMPIGSLTSQFFSNLYLNELDRFVKHQLKVTFYIRYVDDFILLHQDPAQLHKWKLAISDFLQQNLRLSLHPNKTSIQPLHRGCDFLGFIVRPHHITVRPRIVKAFKKRLYFFNHLLDPVGFPHFNPPPNNPWARQIRSGLLTPPITPSLALVQHMHQVVNSYWGNLCHGDTYLLRRKIYLTHFKKLLDYFYTSNDYKKLLLRPLRLLEQERLIRL